MTETDTRQTISHQRCFRHLNREAVARCLQCGRFYCRECVTEHERRLICSSCLSKLGTKKKSPSRVGNAVVSASLFMLGFFVAWMCYYLVGRTMLSIPASFHEGTLWEQPWWDQ